MVAGSRVASSRLVADSRWRGEADVARLEVRNPRQLKVFREMGTRHNRLRAIGDRRRAFETRMKMYAELAAWWPLLSPPSHYDEEAADLLPTLMSAADAPPRTLLELGCGGGSLASHLKGHLQLTLSDVSPQMLAISRQVNPECEHVLGDMRSLDLGRPVRSRFHSRRHHVRRRRGGRARDARDGVPTLSSGRRHRDRA